MFTRNTSRKARFAHGLRSTARQPADAPCVHALRWRRVEFHVSAKVASVKYDNLRGYASAYISFIQASCKETQFRTEFRSHPSNLDRNRIVFKRKHTPLVMFWSTWGICARRAGKLYKARSRLYRSQILQIHTRWKALAEIYTMHSFAPFSILNFFVKNRHFFLRLN